MAEELFFAGLGVEDDLAEAVHRAVESGGFNFVPVPSFAEDGLPERMSDAGNVTDFFFATSLLSLRRVDRDLRLPERFWASFILLGAEIALLGRSGAPRPEIGLRLFSGAGEDNVLPSIDCTADVFEATLSKVLMAFICADSLPPERCMNGFRDVVALTCTLCWKASACPVVLSRLEIMFCMPSTCVRAFFLCLFVAAVSSPSSKEVREDLSGCGGVCMILQ